MPRKYRRNRRYRKKRNYRRNNNKGKGKYNKIQSVKIKQPGVIVADRQFVKLHYIDSTTNTIGTPANNFGYLRYRSSAFDPNPLVLSNGVIGFTEMATLYRAYRVRGMKIKVNIVNQESFPVIVVIWPSTYDIASAVSSATYLQEMICNPYARMKTLSPTTGMDRQSVKAYLSTKKVIGSKTVQYDDNYQALVNANPATMWYWNIGVYSMTGASFNGGKQCPIEVIVTQYIEFFDRQTFTT